jgi:hypothetical protein
MKEIPSVFNSDFALLSTERKGNRRSKYNATLKIESVVIILATSGLIFQF